MANICNIPFKILLLIILFNFHISTFHCITPRFPSSFTPRHIPEPESQETTSLSGTSTSSTGVGVNYETKYFTQTLDHFNYKPESYQTFQQRYLINSKYWGGAHTHAPIFVYTGNEGDIEWFTQNTGFLLETAPSFNALIVFIEHRYYGKSIPYGGDKKTANANSTTLGYLSSTQALADYATLIIDLKINLTANYSPVIAFGGSYGGMLAAWFRLKYPHVAIGALASSAPILYFDDITSSDGFSDVVSRDYRSESDNCYKVIKNSWQEMDDAVKKTGGLKMLQNTFRICKNDMDGDSLESWLATAYIYTAMTDYPTATNFLKPLPAHPIKQMCKAIDNAKEGSNTFEKLYAAANIYYNYTGNVSCFNLDDHSDPHGLSGWTWQACTEMIMPMDGNNNESIFPASKWNYTERAQYCLDKFNVQPRPNWITTHFGGHNIKRVLKQFGSNIIFFNGLRDPWSAGGVLNDISKSLVAIVAPDGAHHVDLRFSTKEDPDWLKDVRNKELKIIADWISQYYLTLTTDEQPS